MYFSRTDTIGKDGGDAVVALGGASALTQTHRAMVSFAKCLGARRRHEIYLSAPITTGATFVTWRQEIRSVLDQKNPEYKAQHRKHVIEKNIARIVPLVAALRSRFPDRLVIDPTSLEDVDDWIQSDYHNFWCEVITRYAQTVVFADGWQLSHGCVREFGAAVECRSELLTETLDPLRITTGFKMVVDAVRHLEQLGEDSTPLRRSLTKLRNVMPSDGFSGE